MEVVFRSQLGFFEESFVILTLFFFGWGYQIGELEKYSKVQISIAFESVFCDIFVDKLDKCGLDCNVINFCSQVNKLYLKRVVSGE